MPRKKKTTVTIPDYANLGKPTESDVKRAVAEIFLTHTIKPYTLKLDTVKRRARTAYKAGLLTAQAPHLRDQKCRYSVMCSDGVERHCAIGAALPKRMLKDIGEGNRAQSVHSLAGNGYIQFATTEERNAISHIQYLHDSWCGGYENEHEAKFKQAIGL